MASPFSLLHHVPQTKQTGHATLTRRFYFYLLEYGVWKTCPAPWKTFPVFRMQRMQILHLDTFPDEKLRLEKSKNQLHSFRNTGLRLHTLCFRTERKILFRKLLQLSCDFVTETPRA